LPERDNSRHAVRFSGWVLNLRTRRLVAPDGVAVALSNGEFSLRNALCGAPQRVLSRDQLPSMSRLHATEVHDRTIDVQIRRLRRKVEVDSANPVLIVTERGAGYRLASEGETL
jgi:DNA-binding response OmpR family regulator